MLRGASSLTVVCERASLQVAGQRLAEEHRRERELAVRVAQLGDAAAHRVLVREQQPVEVAHRRHPPLLLGEHERADRRLAQVAVRGGHDRAVLVGVAEALDDGVGDRVGAGRDEQRVDADLGLGEVEDPHPAMAGDDRQRLVGEVALGVQDDQAAVVVLGVIGAGSSHHARLARPLTPGQCAAVGLVLGAQRAAERGLGAGGLVGDQRDHAVASPGAGSRWGRSAPSAARHGTRGPSGGAAGDALGGVGAASGARATSGGAGARGMVCRARRMCPIRGDGSCQSVAASAAEMTPLRHEGIASGRASATRRRCRVRVKLVLRWRSMFSWRRPAIAPATMRQAAWLRETTRASNQNSSWFCASSAARISAWASGEAAPSGLRGVAAPDAALAADVEPARHALERREDRRQHLLDGHRMPARGHRGQLGLDHRLVELARVGLDRGGEAAALAQPDDRVAPADVELERLEAPGERVPDAAVRIRRGEAAVERGHELLGADDRHRHLGAAVAGLRVLLEREVGLAEEQPPVQALVDLLMPVLKQREDLLGGGVVGAVRRDRVAAVAPAAPSDQPDGRQRGGDEQRGEQRERRDAGDVGDREQERLLERLERGVRVAVAVTVGGDVAQAAARDPADEDGEHRGAERADQPPADRRPRRGCARGWWSDAAAGTGRSSRARARRGLSRITLPARRSRPPHVANEGRR